MELSAGKATTAETAAIAVVVGEAAKASMGLWLEERAMVMSNSPAAWNCSMNS